MIRFVFLYLFALVRWAGEKNKVVPQGIHGSAVFYFVDRNYPGRHGVVAFALPEGAKTEDYSPDLWGPFGWSSRITFRGLHLYGRDNWGVANRQQIFDNRSLAHLFVEDSSVTFVLAGVRGVLGRHIGPLADAKRFVLVKK